VSQLFNDEKLKAKGFNADVNFTIATDENGLALSPLNLAIQAYRDNDDKIILELLKNYADVNGQEENFGFVPLIMACHMTNEQDALHIIKILCSHTFYQGQERLCNINVQDNAGNSALHHAALTNKLELTKYFIEELQISTALENGDNQAAIDVTSDAAIEAYLATYQQKKAQEEDKQKKQSKLGKILSVLKVKPKRDESEVEDNFLKNMKGHRERLDTSTGKPNMGRRTVNIVDTTNKKALGNKLGLDDFHVVNRIGGGAFGSVYLVTPKLKKKNSSGEVAAQPYAMKILEKENILSKNLARYALTERNVLQIAGKHPFIVGLDFAFQSQSRLYLVMEYCPGGDLGQQIRVKRKLSEEEARLYICEIIVALEFLHKNGVIFRDLKPENIVLSEDGHINLTDFGLSKENVGDYTALQKSFVGSIAYLAPEILKKQGHTRSLDWYLCGVLLYELIVGIPPYYHNNRNQLFENIKYGPLRIPMSMSNDARDLILNLLNRNPRKRLGAGESDAEQIKEHAFFKDVNWEDVYNRKLDMPQIEVKKNLEVNVEHLREYKKGEKESE